MDLNRSASFDRECLAPYACRSLESKGRRFPEQEHRYRSCYQRDRDRIIHSAAFRRLEYKTQVFVFHEGDYYRTRLTHSLEVAQIARTIAKALILNEELSEAISLAHDLGHTPFGHSGEEVLNDLMRDHGGFEHNMQSLRVVDILEERYPDFAGLNLSWEVREGIIKHSTVYDTVDSKSIAEFGEYPFPSLEAQAVDLADEIAYDNHDLDDGLMSGLIKEEQLADFSLWKKAADSVDQQYPGVNHILRRHIIIRGIINTQVTNLLETSSRLIRESAVASVDDVRRYDQRLIRFTEDLERERLELRLFLQGEFYRNYRVVRMAEKAKRFITWLFKEYIRAPAQLVPTFQKRLADDDIYRVVCDYVAGMTDRFALDEYERLFNPYQKV